MQVLHCHPPSHEAHGGMGGGPRTSMRMTAAQKAEYDQYMQNLLKTRGFNPGPTLQISQDDNNPFSDGFQTKLQVRDVVGLSFNLSFNFFSFVFIYYIVWVVLILVVFFLS